MPESQDAKTQYARALEHAIEVFGSQSLAEDWLNKPCKYLNGQEPLELTKNSLGFESVMGYLSRIGQGVYQ
ncbi:MULTISPECIES: MbcA/ParS/Xre antitoxin family protein [Pseudomonas]|nr:MULTISPECIES: MbcA/ParS/Xre antitoxin family protein [Pseudomonas]